MAAIAPVGDEIPDCAMCAPGFGRGTQICQRVIVSANQRLPGRSTGTDVKRNAGSGESAGFLFKGMICLVTPIEGNEVLGRDALPRVLADQQVGLTKPVEDLTF